MQRRPGMYWWIDVTEGPLVGRQRAVWVLEPLPTHHKQLILGERRVDVCQCHRVECEVPRGEPRVFPGVGHREDVPRVEVEPAGVATLATFGRRWRLGGIAVEPPLHFV